MRTIPLLILAVIIVVMAALLLYKGNQAGQIIQQIPEMQAADRQPVLQELQDQEFQD